MSATSYPRPVFASIDEIRVGMVVLTHSGRRLKVTHIDKRRGVVHYDEVTALFAGFPHFAAVVESVIE